MEISDQSVCPHCQAIPDSATGLCRCPATARAPTAPLDLSSGALVAQAERLFETYLAARLVRARRQLQAAKTALRRDARKRAHLDELRRAEQETERLQAQVLEQARKAAQAREQQPAPAPRARPAPAAAGAVASEHFRTLQAAKAEEAYDACGALGRRSRPDHRDCPRCGARIAGESEACVCGHRFAANDAAVLAEPFLSDSEIAALRKAIKAS